VKEEIRAKQPSRLIFDANLSQKSAYFAIDEIANYCVFWHVS
jgi:hypothetical protein